MSPPQVREEKHLGEITNERVAEGTPIANLVNAPFETLNSLKLVYSPSDLTAFTSAINADRQYPAVDGPLF